MVPNLELHEIEGPMRTQGTFCLFMELLPWTCEIHGNFF